MKNLIATLMLATATALALGQERPVMAQPEFVDLLNGYSNDSVRNLYFVDDARYRIDCERKNIVAMDLVGFYPGGQTMTFYIKSIPMAQRPSMEIQLYNFEQAQWISMTTRSDYNPGELSVTVPAEEYVDPDMNIVLTRVIWYLHSPTKQLWVDCANWKFSN